jgi:hypothetical protein
MSIEDELTELAKLEPDGAVLSVYLQIDPRDPANTHSTPRWRVALHNGLRDVQREADERGDGRDGRLALRDLAKRVEDEIDAHVGSDLRGRGFAWLLSADGSLDRRYTLQIPLRGDRIVWDRRPYVLPLIDAADRGRKIGLILVDGEHVRLLCWEMGKLTEPEESLYTFEPEGAWHRYTERSGGRGVWTVSAREGYEQRMEDQRERFIHHAAGETARRIGELGWERLIVVGEVGVTERFVAALPQNARERVAAQLDRNLLHEPLSEIAQRVEPLAKEAWERDVSGALSAARERAAAGGNGTVGADDTLAALAEARVSHLVLDPNADFSAAELGELATQVMGDAGPALIPERAVEHALQTDARVTLVDGDGLGDVGGIAALLRY